MQNVPVAKANLELRREGNFGICSSGSAKLTSQSPYSPGGYGSVTDPGPWAIGSLRAHMCLLTWPLCPHYWEPLPHRCQLLPAWSSLPGFMKLCSPESWPDSLRSQTWFQLEVRGICGKSPVASGPPGVKLSFSVPDARAALGSWQHVWGCTQPFYPWFPHMQNGKKQQTLLHWSIMQINRQVVKCLAPIKTQ